LVCGMSHCRICGKSIPSVYRKRHEAVMCLKMRYDRGDPDVLQRFPDGLGVHVRRDEAVEPGQLRLFEVIGGPSK
jgi:hypothetical protein